MSPTTVGLVGENCALLGYSAASSGNFLPTFRDNLTAPSTWRRICCYETSVTNSHYLLSNNPEERSSHLLRSGTLKSHIRSPTTEKNLGNHGPEVQIFKQTYTINIYLIAVPTYSSKRRFVTQPNVHTDGSTTCTAQ